MRMPLPPPPADALIMTGKPAVARRREAVRRRRHGAVRPGTTGTPAARIVSLATDLSPILEIVSGVGPMKIRSWSSQTRANSAFSARKP